MINVYILFMLDVNIKSIYILRQIYFYILGKLFLNKARTQIKQARSTTLTKTGIEHLATVYGASAAAMVSSPLVALVSRLATAAEAPPKHPGIEADHLAATPEHSSNYSLEP